MAGATFEELYGELNKIRVGTVESKETAFSFLTDLAFEKSEGKEWAAFEGELKRVHRSNPSPWVPTSSAVLKSRIEDWFLTYFASPVPVCFCENGTLFNNYCSFFLSSERIVAWR